MLKKPRASKWIYRARGRLRIKKLMQEDLRRLERKLTTAVQRAAEEITGLKRGDHVMVDRKFFTLQGYVMGPETTGIMEVRKIELRFPGDVLLKDPRVYCHLWIDPQHEVSYALFGKVSEIYRYFTKVKQED